MYLKEFFPQMLKCCLVEIPDAVKGAKIVAAITQVQDEKSY